MTLDLFEEPKQVSTRKINWWAIVAIVVVGLLLWNKLGPSIPLGPINDNPPGLHVLIVEERDDRGSISNDVAEGYQSTELIEWFQKNKATWLIVDQDDDISQEKNREVWEKLKAMPRSSLPWIYISNPPKSVISSKITSLKDTLNLLNKGL